MSASTTVCAAGAAARPGRLIKCRVKVKTAAGDQHRYTALFSDTVGAAMDALDRFDNCKISVEAIRE